ncbi:MAG TPA: PQQ-binding-like beta-propeller repeat protein [Polyangia bacterium]|nr:PQQ-binding-like beta-propeller repeat protein [Polyangia bacterium]
MRKLLPAVLVCVALATAHAVTTRTWRLTNYKDFEEGEATGVLLSSLGEASSGFGASRVEIGEAVVYSSVAAPDGTIYVGTGDQGAIYAYAKGKARKLAKLDAVLVTSLAIGPGGTLYAGVMPGGRVFAVEKDGRTKEVAKLDAEHVWALAYDEGRQTLYAATGPNGRLFSIDLKGPDRPLASRVKLVYDTGEKHLLSLVRGDDGALYAGSADQAILYKIVPDPAGAKITALHDFEGEEVRAIARRGPTLYVAVNAFQKSGSASLDSSGPLAPRGTKMVLPPAPAIASAPSSLPSRDRKGKGAVYRVDPDGRVEQLHALAEGYFTALHVDADGNVYAAAGSNGRVYLIRPDRTVITAFDLPERQVLTMSLDGPPDARVLGTGDAGALYQLSSDPPRDAHYLTKVFDAQFPARWGNLRWSGLGALALQTRSGNTSKPDKTWSAWQGPSRSEKLGDGGGGKIGSPDGRYLQVRVNFAAPHTVLRDLTVYYLPQNQRPRVTELTVGDEATQKRVPISLRAGKPRSPVVKLRWKVENPDDDELIYRLYFREESEVNWKPLGGPEPITRAEYDWNTESIPDGNYVVKVVASDERANPREEALEHSLTSSPFLVDNRKPELADVKVAYPFASGRARDSFSAISELAFSVDGGEWQPVAPRDGIFDETAEDFSFKLPSGLQAGAHSLAVRAVDAADNVGAVQITFRVK